MDLVILSLFSKINLVVMVLMVFLYYLVDIIVVVVCGDVLICDFGCYFFVVYV